MIFREFYELTARKEHACDFLRCKKPIEKGELYVKYDSNMYGGLYYKLHKDCYRKQWNKEIKGIKPF